jgi:hypothetical protein
MCAIHLATPTNPSEVPGRERCPHQDKRVPLYYVGIVRLLCYCLPATPCLCADATTLSTGFTRGTGQIWLDGVECTGLETSLMSCPSDQGFWECDHSQDAGVRCAGTTCRQGDIRLRGGTDNEGRVEVCNTNNVWGTVCGRSWENVDAGVVCRQLGLPTDGMIEMNTELRVSWFLRMALLCHG